MSDQLQRAINLARKTGDKIIIFDSRYPQNSFVLLPLDDYEESLTFDDDYPSSENFFTDLEDSYLDYDGDIFEDEVGLRNYYKDKFNDEKKDNDFANKNQVENDILSSNNTYLTEEERIDKINRDLSMSVDDDLTVDDDYDKMNFLEGNFAGKANFPEEQDGKRRHWSIPRNIKEVAEEVIEEDRHYLEEITF
jgi:hypothetical protein